MKALTPLWPLLLLPAVAVAQPLPDNYDSRGYCVALGARTGGRTTADLDSCLADEAHSRAALEARWELASAAIRDRCLLRNARHSYDLLNLCVVTEMERAR